MSTSSSESELTAAPISFLSEADREALSDIAATLANTYKHGCLYFGICNSARKITLLQNALGQLLAPKGIAVSRVVLAERDCNVDPPRGIVRISDPVAYLSEQRSSHPRFFFVHGLPELIREQTGGDPFEVAPVSQLLNFRRELFRERALCVFFWLDQETVPYLMQKAPDFWAFRSGTARFEGDELMPPRGAASGWQDSGPAILGRWAGDLQEKLGQLAVYRQKSPPDKNAIGNLLLEIGRLYFERKELQEALQTLHEALTLFEKLKLREKIRDVQIWLARSFRAMRHLDKAEEYLREGIAIDAELRNQQNLANDYNNLSQIYDARGQLEEAEKWLRKAVDIDERLGNEPSLAIRYNDLSQIYKARGQLEEAEKWLRRAIKLIESKGPSATLNTLNANLDGLLQEREAQRASNYSS